MEAWRIDNLLDETYQDHLTGVNRAMRSDITVGEHLYAAERTISAGIVFSFQSARTGACHLCPPGTVCPAQAGVKTRIGARQPKRVARFNE